MSFDVPTSGGGASFPPLNPGPAWNVPRVSLPGLFGVQRQFTVEWWYYVGTVYDTQGKAFSLQIEIMRAAVGSVQVANGTTGIGWTEDGESHYVSGLGFGFGAAEGLLTLPSLLVPPVSDESFSASMVPLLEVTGSGSDLFADLQINSPFPSGWDGWKFEYLSRQSAGNPVGSIGSVYAIGAHGRGFKTSTHQTGTSKLEYRIELTVADQRGMVMEGVSGYVGPKMFPTPNPDAPASYECAQPYLQIQKGGALTIGGESHKIERGYLWLDRQMVAAQQSSSSDDAGMPHNAEELKEFLILKGPSPKSLYLGDWMGFVFDNGFSLVLAEFWQPSTPQWITGTRVGRPPQNGFGNLYCKIDGESFRKNGGQPLRPRLSLTNDDWDYDVNILTPDEPETSPHWTSPRTSQTYATAWRIDFAPWLLEYGIPGTVYAYAVSDTCEIVLLSKKGAFFEGAAILYADKQKTQRLGHVFVEQMGFN